MGQNREYLLNGPIIELASIDSTNNYAMRLIDADTAQAGLVVVADHQTQGKGQRGKSWADESGSALLMSVVMIPNRAVSQQFLFNAAITTAIARWLMTLYDGWDVRIKWPNDLLINDRKAAGLLIENVLRGSKWVFSVVGLGLNVAQESFPHLPYATSLFRESGQTFFPRDLILPVRAAMAKGSSRNDPSVLADYRSLLFRKGEWQEFTDGMRIWPVQILGITEDGRLEVVLEDQTRAYYPHGKYQWVWR